MNIRDYRKFVDQFNYNVGDWKFRDKDGNLHDLIVLEMARETGDIIFEIDDHKRCGGCAFFGRKTCVCLNEANEGIRTWEDTYRCKHFTEIER